MQAIKILRRVLQCKRGTKAISTDTTMHLVIPALVIGTERRLLSASRLCSLDKGQLHGRISCSTSNCSDTPHRLQILPALRRHYNTHHRKSLGDTFHRTQVLCSVSDVSACTKASLKHCVSLFGLLLAGSRVQRHVNFTGAPLLRRLPCASKPYIDMDNVRRSVELSYGGTVQ